METNNKKSLGYKIQKNPFLIGLFLIVITVALVCIFTLSSVVKKQVAARKAAEATSTEATETVSETEPVTEGRNTHEPDLSKAKIYAEDVESVAAKAENKRVGVTVTFKDEEALLAAFISSSVVDIETRPVFCFYLSGGVEAECPGLYRFSEDGKSVTFYLYAIEDLQNAASLTDEVTVTYDNVLTALPFNLYLQHKEKTDMGRTLLGTYAQSVDAFRGSHAPVAPEIEDRAAGISDVKLTKTKQFMWLDIYFEDEAAYKDLNHDLENNFVCYGFEYAGKLGEAKFLTTAYDDSYGFYMLRCKIDTFAMSVLAKDIGESDFTLSDLLDLDIDVWTSDYETETSLFRLCPPAEEE